MTAPTWTACVLVHYRDSDRPRRAMDGTCVCAGCHAKTLRALLQLAPLHRLLGEIRAITTSAPRTGSRSTDTPIPLHPAAADHRRHIRQHLAGWVLDVCESRQLTPPLIDAAGGSQPEADALVGWLLVHHRWLLAQDYADEYADDLTELHSAAWAIAYPSGRRYRTFAPCPACADGTLAAWLAPGDLLPPALTCDTCGEEVPPAQWLTGRGRRWLTAVELAQVWDQPLRTVQRWAQRAHWPSDGGWPARYDTDAAERTRAEMTRVVLTQVDRVAQTPVNIESGVR